MVIANDEYSIWRTAPDAIRLCYQHFCWRELYKSNIHPSIDLTDRPDLRIAELATGHGLWAIQVAEEYPHAQVEASDISLSLIPAKPDLPSNLSFRQWSFFDPVPEEWKGAFDLLHVRLIIQPFGGNQDPRPVLEKFVSMLKPGGYLQWDEYDYHDAEKNNVYSANDPVLFPHPEITHKSSTKVWKTMIKIFQWPTEHFAQFEDYFAAAGLISVVAHRKRPPPSIFRAFYEHWYALVAQLLPVLESKEMEAGHYARHLLLQMKKDAVVDGVYSAHITKFMIGRKPADSEKRFDKDPLIRKEVFWKPGSATDDRPGCFSLFQTFQAPTPPNDSEAGRLKYAILIKRPAFLSRLHFYAAHTHRTMPEHDPLSVQRGDYGRNVSSNLLFIVGRALTFPAQYFLITSHPLSRIGIPPPPSGAPSITILGRTFPRLPFLTALMPGVLSAKHLIWINFMMRERMTMKFATFAILSDFIYEAVSSTIFTAASVNPMWSERCFYIGFTIYMASVAVELLAELQRIAFKAKKENQGKVCTTGFWAITRHVNYTANVLFGFGYGLATGGPLYALATAGMYISNFTLNAMPSIEKYCREKYGEQWEKYERDVPWQLFPGIY